MNALALAKRRAGLRRSDDGAVMFIVAMTLAVLASVGVYALAAAATEVRTSGNERQNTQTHYLAQYGVLGAAHELTPGNAYSTVMSMLHGEPGHELRIAPGRTGGGARHGARVPCAWGSQSSARSGRPGSSSRHHAVRVPQAYTPGIAPGSFGTVPMFGDFFVELTEAMQPTPRRILHELRRLLLSAHGDFGRIHPAGSSLGVHLGAARGRGPRDAACATRAAVMPFPIERRRGNQTTMGLHPTQVAAASAGVALLVTASRARAQQIDTNPPLPNVLLLIDNSGSMERMIDGNTPETDGNACNYDMTGKAILHRRWRRSPTAGTT